MLPRLRLQSPAAMVEIAPTLGATITDYRLANGTQILRPCPEDTTDPFAGCFLMMPWTNRLSNGVMADGQHFPLAPNHPGFPLPIHGLVAQQEWQVTTSAPDMVKLVTEVNGPAPYTFDAEVRYKLDGAALQIDLTCFHRGATRAPYGMGLHPWFPRKGPISITAKAHGYITLGPDMLPTGTESLGDHADWNFSHTAPLPDTLIDTCFAGWDGQARLEGGDGWALDIQVAPRSAWYQVYSPGSDADFFCFEPVTHPVNAHNAPGQPGLSQLAAGQSATFSIRLSPV